MNNRIAGLDLLRSGAIILVLIAHSGSLYSMKQIDNFSFPFFNFAGYLGVELFFVLSGFLIGGLLMKSYEKHQGFRWTDFVTFCLRRWLKTLPNYFVVLLLGICVYWFDRGILYPDVMRYLTFTQNLLSAPMDNVFAITWSLAVEEWFYLLFPLVWILILRCAQFLFNR